MSSVGQILDADAVDDADAVHALPAAAPAVSVATFAGAVVSVALEDLLPDRSGEVVLSTVDGLSVELLARQTLVDTGVSDRHVTASGFDVSGFSYYSFSGGLTVYFSHESLVTVSHGEAT